MQGKLAVALLIGVLSAFTWAVLAAQQEVRPTPGPGSGTVRVIGAVDIGTMPPMHARQSGDWTVQARQSGDWTVAIANTSAINIASPPFIRAGGRYVVTWPNGTSESVRMSGVGPGGWARAEDAAGRTRWINLAVAQSIAEQ